MCSEDLPPYSQNSDRLPPYSRFSEAPASKPSPNHYVTRSRRMALDLGQRYQSTLVPAFGREGLVEGHVWIQSFEHVEKIQVTLTGVVASYFLEFGVPCLPSVKRLTRQTHEIWSSSQDPNSSNEGRSLAFALVFPEYVDGMGTDSRLVPLPPSASVVMRNANAHVAYVISVDMYRKGWRSHDVVKSEILYLPRTTTRYSRPYLPLPNSEKLRPVPDKEWSISYVPQKSKAASSAYTPSDKAHSEPHSSLPQSVREDIVVRFWLPDGLRYPSGRKILWGVTFIFPRIGGSASDIETKSNRSSMSDYDIDALIAGVSVRLVCISTVAVRGEGSRREQVVAQGKVFNVAPDARTDLGERKVIVMGCLVSGEAEQHMSWNVSGFASVVYEMRLSIKPDGPDAPVWEYSERIIITSHESDGEIHNAGVPALLLPGATRGPIPGPLNLMDL